MTKTKTDRHDVLVDQQIDPEVVSFRAQFDQKSPLGEIVREGARRMLQSAIDAEVDDFIAQHAHRIDEQGRRLVVKNGSLPERKILTGAGAIPVTQGRVRDNDPDPERRVRFSPSVLPSYLRKTSSIEELIPWLYLKGISTGDFPEALQALVGERAGGLSANVVSVILYVIACDRFSVVPK
ncbi:Transposase, Mutator family [Crateriforma conspicua]|uniref:Mutator family transposase n=1 Tax=Crateriforma conspicua TaxID=2527996 RepID=A0A5C6FPZ8_9PLAN|nr:transposase [Crateriforma conspicua]TWU62556.1 Transposase, Mutator family [Crateriforma conspicua]